jgi:hypothetical protein
MLGLPMLNILCLPLKYYALRSAPKCPYHSAFVNKSEETECSELSEGQCKPQAEF